MQCRFSGPNRTFDWLIDWLFVRLFVCLIDWLIVCLFDCLIDSAQHSKWDLKFALCILLKIAIICIFRFYKVRWLIIRSFLLIARKRSKSFNVQYAWFGRQINSSAVVIREAKGTIIKSWVRAWLRFPFRHLNNFWPKWKWKWKWKSTILRDIRMPQKNRGFSMIAFWRSERSKIAENDHPNTPPTTWDVYNFANNRAISE
jgi:hypothetical protein